MILFYNISTMMTIKKRLVFSNIIMTTVPTVITLFVGAVFLGVLYTSLYRTHSLGYRELKNFEQSADIVSGIIDKALDKKTDDKKIHELNKFLNLFDKNYVSIKLFKNGTSIYSYGTEKDKDGMLMRYIDILDEDSYISIESRQLYRYKIVKPDGIYYAYIFGSFSNSEHMISKESIIISALVLLTIMISAIFITHRFVSSFVFKRINKSLDVLSKGFKEVSNGDFSYRISYNRNDEFFPICNAFNYMTERIELAEKQQLKNDNERREMIMHLSHDIRSPLTSIRAYVEGLIDGVAKDEQMRNKYLETVKRKTIDIERMVKNIFNFAKFDTESVKGKIRKTDVGVVVNDLIDGIRDDYEISGLNIACIYEKELYASINSAVLLRIILNIFDNSLKYTDKIDPQILIVIKKSGENIELIFADNGPGVEEENLNKIFELFYRTDKARVNPQNGNGIGLAYVSSSVLSMGGSVRAMRNLTGGLSIIIKFPLFSENEY